MKKIILIIGYLQVEETISLSQQYFLHFGIELIQIIIDDFYNTITFTLKGRYIIG